MIVQWYMLDIYIHVVRPVLDRFGTPLSYAIGLPSCWRNLSSRIFFGESFYAFLPAVIATVPPRSSGSFSGGRPDQSEERLCLPANQGSSSRTDSIRP